MNRFIVRVRITLNIYKYTKVMRDKQLKKLKEMLKTKSGNQLMVTTLAIDLFRIKQ